MDYTGRVVRVFVSSTFSDMHAEREELVKFIFPEIRKRCRERNVEFVDVDLRWGVTDEEKAEGKVLPICLAEIERCRPYFIGILGERYGWVPKEIDHTLIEEQRWISEHRDKSVTELEILYGVLKNKDMKGIAFFYFRDPDKSRLVESKSATQPGLQNESEEAKRKLALLKDSIRKSGYPVRESFPDAKDFGNLVLNDLWGMIDERYPKQKAPTHIEKQRIAHEAFAQTRRKVYIGRKEYFNVLDNHVSSNAPPLVITGKSGSGKSALIANWVEQYRNENPGTFILTHYIGSTPESTDYVHILRRIIEEIKEHYSSESAVKDELHTTSVSGQMEDEIPSDPKAIVEKFPMWIAKASENGGMVLVIDALNQLEEKNNASDLNWLPAFFPENIRVILSTLPGNSFEALLKRNLKTLTVHPMDGSERKRLITDYLGLYRKKLDNIYIEQIIEAEQSANPLYLKTLLEELRIFGVHEKLNFIISHYLRAKQVDDLFQLVLERLERDYEQQVSDKGLVRNVMRLIWASRKGLSEKEILELVGIPNAIWSPLYLAIEDSLFNRSGLLNFIHSYLRKAVEDRYLPTDQIINETHLHLADYFEAKELNDRGVEEIPWQLKQANSWDRLKDCIADLKMFLKLTTDEYKYELVGYWQLLADKADIVTVYNDSLKTYEQSDVEDLYKANMHMHVASFLKLCAKYKGAEQLFRRAYSIYEKALGKDHPTTNNCLNDLGLILNDIGSFDSAEDCLRKALLYSKKVNGPEHKDTASSMINLATLLRSKGNYAEAESLIRSGLSIDEKIYGVDNPKTFTAMHNLAFLLYHKGDYENAEPVFRHTLALNEKVYGTDHLLTTYTRSQYAQVLYALGDYKNAEQQYLKSIAIYERVLGKDHPDVANPLIGIGQILERKGDYNSAEAIFRRTTNIFNNALGDSHPYTANSMQNLASVLQAKGNLNEAEMLQQQSVSIYKKALGLYKKETAVAMHNLALILQAKGNLDEAEKIQRRAIPVYEKTYGSEHNDTAAAMHVLASILRDRGNLEEAEKIQRSALPIYEKTLGYEHRDTATAMHLLALILHARSNLIEAEKIQRRALTIYEKSVGIEHRETGTAMHLLASILQARGNFDEAEEIQRRALPIYEKSIGLEHRETATAMHLLAMILQAKGNLDEAEEIQRKALSIYNKVLGAEHRDTATAMHVLATILQAKGNLDEAEMLIKIVLPIYEKTFGTEHSQTNAVKDLLASIQHAKGN